MKPASPIIASPIDAGSGITPNGVSVAGPAAKEAATYPGVAAPLNIRSSFILPAQFGSIL